MPTQLVCTFRYALLLSLALTGCHRRHQVPSDPHYVALARQMHHSRLAAPPPANILPPQLPELAGPHPVEVYLGFALNQNPQVWAARKRVEAAAMRVPQAASLENPTAGFTTWPFPVNAPQTASGWMVADVTVSQEIPWKGTLATRAAMAEAEANMARANLAAVELTIAEQVKRAYYELYFVQQSLRVMQRDRKLVENFAEIADVRYRAAAVSQQDVLRAQLELSEIDRNLIELRQQLISAQARLARLLHISPDTNLRALDDLDPQQLPQDLQQLYAQAVAARPELHQQIAEIRRDQWQVELARLQYYPDFGVSFNWGIMTRESSLAPTADGEDNLGVGLMADLPIYRKRIDAGVREAQARAVASAREYDSLRDQALEEAKDLFVQAQSQAELLALFNKEIIPKAEFTLEAATRAYEAGETDFLQLLDNWRQLLRYQIAYYRLESQLRQTLAALERVIASPLPTVPPVETIPAGPANQP